jgi:hypothetical protein
MDPSSFIPDPVAPTRWPAQRRPLHLVNFFCHAPLAKSVVLIGDFNAWDPKAHLMTRMPDGG